MKILDQFQARLDREWLEPFCTKRGFSTDGFVRESLQKLSPVDAEDFIYAIDQGLVEHESGVFRTPLSKAKEQIFWEGPKDTNPRKITLWLEPIITIAALARLHRDYGWPSDCLGLQSATWAFDLVAYVARKTEEGLVCEVKKSTQEVDKLIGFMLAHANSDPDLALNLKGSELNAFRKVIALRRSSSPTFWAVGPGGYSRVFTVVRDNSGLILDAVGDEALYADMATGQPAQH